MNQVMSQVKGVMSPVCSMVQTNKKLLSMVLVLVVVATYLPVDEVLKTNVQSKVLSTLKIKMGTVVRVVLTVLFLCLFLNNDVLNLVLLLWLCKAMKM